MLGRNWDARCDRVVEGSDRGGGGEGAIVWERNWMLLLEELGVEVATEELVGVSRPVGDAVIREATGAAAEESLMVEFV